MIGRLLPVLLLALPLAACGDGGSTAQDPADSPEGSETSEPATPSASDPSPSEEPSTDGGTDPSPSATPTPSSTSTPEPGGTTPTPTTTPTPDPTATTTPPSGALERIRVVGEVVSGGDCVVVRDDNGITWTVAGDGAERLAPGARVQVTGTPDLRATGCGGPLVTARTITVLG